MIVGIEGRPGSGKSYFAVDRMVEALRSGRRIVTNMNNVYYRRIAWDLSGRNLKGAKEILSRITVISTKNFLSEFAKLNLKNTDIILDEVMLDFFSRDWAKMPKSTIFFLTQHRKYRCDFYYITQSIERMDNVLKSLTQYYIRLRNTANWKMGPFRVPAVMCATWFQEDLKTIHSVDYRRPSKKIYGYYDTYALFENEAVEGVGQFSNVFDVSTNHIALPSV
jgi:zona occludens toxin (predicted ATPase)